MKAAADRIAARDKKGTKKKSKACKKPCAKVPIKLVKRIRKKRGSKLADDPYKRAQIAHHAQLRNARKKLRTPPWADLELIAKVYEAAQLKTQETGIAHHVDHIYPMNGALVSGLHVHSNLRVIPAHENLRKGSKMPPELEHRLEDPEIVRKLRRELARQSRHNERKIIMRVKDLR